MKIKFSKYISYVLAIGVMLGLVSCDKYSINEIHYEDDRSIIIGAWVAPPPQNALGGNPDFINNDTYKEIAESGINMIYGLYEGADANGLRALDAAQANNIKYLIYDRSLRAVHEEDFELLADFIKLYKDHPAFAGNLAYDEPGGAQFDRLGALHEEYRRILPDKMFYVNLFPTYSSVAQRDGLTYKEYVTSYIEKVKPEFVSFDYYPLMTHAVEGNYIKEDFLHNIEIIATASRNADLPFWSFIQAMSFTTAGMTNREVSEEDIRWQVYTNLAFGARGIQYFCYWTPSEDGIAQFGDAMIDKEGNKTETYYAVKNVNSEVLLFDHIYLNFENIGVMRFPESNLPNTMFMENPLMEFEPVKNIDGEHPYIIGCFKDEDENNALIIVNYSDPSHGLTNKVTINFNKARAITSFGKDGKEQEILSGGVYELTLAPGEGKFILIHK